MDRIMRFGLIAAVAAIALLVPTRAASDTPPPVIEVTVSLTDLPPAIVNLTVPEQAAPVVNLPEFPTQPAPVVNVTIPEQPAPIVNVEQGKPQVIYEDREVEVERIVEVPACLDYADLPHFDLANAMTAVYPGKLWGIVGSDYGGMTWREDSPKPEMKDIIGGWLAHLSESC